MSEPRFPPPRNEASYREAALPALADPIAPIAHVEKHRTIVTLAEEPGVIHVDPLTIKDQDARLAVREAEGRRSAVLALLIFPAVIIVLLLVSWAFPSRSARRLEKAKRDYDALQRHSDPAPH
jgi:hypothetical protein